MVLLCSPRKSSSYGADELLRYNADMYDGECEYLPSREQATVMREINIYILATLLAPKFELPAAETQIGEDRTSAVV
jgi:hypothetical protein